MTVQVRAEDVEESIPQSEVQNVQYHHAGYDEALGVSAADDAESVRSVPMAPKIGRNDVCPCGSGKKYKHCHGKLS